MFGKDTGSKHAHAVPKPAIRLCCLPHRHQLWQRIITESIILPSVKQYRQRCQFTFFLGGRPDQQSGYAGQLEAVGRCLEWFVFDFVLPDCLKTPAQLWYETCADTLSPTQRQLARDCLKFRCGIFELTAIQHDKMLELRDLARPPLRYLVEDAVLAKETKPGQLLLGRIFPYQRNYLLSGMTTVLESQALRQVLDYLHYAQTETDGLCWDGLFMEAWLGRDVHQLFDLPHEELGKRLDVFFQLCHRDSSSSAVERYMLAANDYESLMEQLVTQLPICSNEELEAFTTLLAAFLETISSY